MALLDDVRVVDLSVEIAGPYCTKLLADAGADVVKVESEHGDPLRRWTASGADPGEFDGALFQYLNASKRSIVGDVRSTEVSHLLSATDLVVLDDRIAASEVLDWLRGHFAQLSIVSVTPFGRTGPWAARPATEFVLQALCGSIASRGTVDREPFYAGGRLGEWIAGSFAALLSLAILRGARRSRKGDLADISMLECMSFCMGGAQILARSLGMPSVAGPARSVEIPSIEPTADGYIGFCTITGQQFQDFLVMIGRPDLVGDSDLATFVGRQRRRDEFLKMVHDWTLERPCAEIEELAAAMRIPVSPIGRPETLTSFEQFSDRGVYVSSAVGRFSQPRVPYRIDESDLAGFRAAPRLGEHQGEIVWAATEPRMDLAASAGRLPLEGITIVDLTAFWAGPSATLALAALGAQVIKVESIQRPDGMRFVSARPPGTDSWWEWGSVYQGNNFNKLGITLDLSRPDGREILRQLLTKADALIENFSPRVLDNFGITWELVHAINPRLIMVRMPAFGLSGPWRDRTGFAQTMEQASGLAWMTGFKDGPPVIPRGPCDPLAGLHAAFALLAALHERDRSGQGHFVEATMVEAALNVAAESVIEYQAYGRVVSRDGNRGPSAAPQGLYACAGDDNWLALAIATDQQWVSLRQVLGDPHWARRQSLARAAGRRAAHDLIDTHLQKFFADIDVCDAVEELLARGIPASEVVEPARLIDNPQMRARNFIESFDHTQLGHHETIGLPFRLSSYEGPWLRKPSPMLGQDNRFVLQGILGLSDCVFHELIRSGVVGHRPVGT